MRLTLEQRRSLRMDLQLIASHAERGAVTLSRIEDFLDKVDYLEPPEEPRWKQRVRERMS